ncbi:MAG: CDP-glucose 4,6-dehydratase, partial [Bacteroidota bacterium]
MQKDFLEFYEGKKVFITGHTGFKGSWLVFWLSLLNADIKGYALSPIGKLNLYEIINGDQYCNSVISDIRDQDRLKKELLNFKPDIIFHLAAQPIVKQSYIDPLETIEVNVNGTANLLEAAREIENPCQIVIITTDKVYENKEWYYPYREEDTLGGHDPYSMSKACAELVVKSFRKSFFDLQSIEKHGKGIASVRAGNVIGGGDWTEYRLVPDIAKAIAS